MEECFVVCAVDGAVGESGGAEGVFHCTYVLFRDFYGSRDWSLCCQHD